MTEKAAADVLTTKKKNKKTSVASFKTNATNARKDRPLLDPVALICSSLLERPTWPLGSSNCAKSWPMHVLVEEDQKQKALATYESFLASVWSQAARFMNYLEGLY
jgi:hypothetical protein